MGLTKARTSELYVGQPYRPQQVALGLEGAVGHVLTSLTHCCHPRAEILKSPLFIFDTAKLGKKNPQYLADLKSSLVIT